MTYTQRAQFVVTVTVFAVVFFFSLSSLSPSLRIGKAYRNGASLPKP